MLMLIIGFVLASIYIRHMILHSRDTDIKRDFHFPISITHLKLNHSTTKNSNFQFPISIMCFLLNPKNSSSHSANRMDVVAPERPKGFFTSCPSICFLTPLLIYCTTRVCLRVGRLHMREHGQGEINPELKMYPRNGTQTPQHARSMLDARSCQILKGKYYFFQNLSQVFVISEFVFLFQFSLLFHQNSKERELPFASFNSLMGISS